ncbi:hypothetical protein [Thermomonospora catenispora]|uniref:hypothetical protein n=1 Tax=Thermomonospora catenispora TaxID=2493090 RepID=UPI0011227961|nr:hypothetical protein [Thermomonospora catenispora]TNY38295.1 hypothetical protein EIO00_04625 [Thermomonospora catenispora]
MSVGTAWDDPDLAAVLRAPARKRLRQGLALLAESRGFPELRALRVRVLARGLTGRLKELAAAPSDDPDAMLLLGTTRIHYAWNIRGGAYAEHVKRERFQRFWAELQHAQAPLLRAADLLPPDPVPWDQLQRYAMGMQLEREELDRVWHEVLWRAPSLYSAHCTRVQAISAKWYGSDEEAAAFAEEVVDRAAPGDPVVAAAAAVHFEIAGRRIEDMSRCEAVLRSHFRDPAVTDLMVRAADRWLRSPMPHPRTPEAHHMFGAAFHFAGEEDRARHHLRQTDRRMPELLPWSVASLTPARYYAKTRAALGV